MLCWNGSLIGDYRMPRLHPNSSSQKSWFVIIPWTSTTHSCSEFFTWIQLRFSMQFSHIDANKLQLTSNVWYSTFQFHISLSNLWREGHWGSGLVSWGLFRVRWGPFRVISGLVLLENIPEAGNLTASDSDSHSSTSRVVDNIDHTANPFHVLHVAWGVNRSWLMWGSIRLIALVLDVDIEGWNTILADTQKF